VPAPVGLVLRQIGADVADLNVIGRDGDIEISRVLKIIAGSVGRPVVSQYWRPMATSASTTSGPTAQRSSEGLTRS
jgi:hypothetical protein